MKRLKNIKFTPSMVVASLALLVALSGTGVAAIAIVTPSPNTVGTLQLKPNAVTSGKVLNGSLLKGDFKAGQILNGAPGAVGPQGPQGAKGDTGAAGAAGVAAPGYIAGVISTTSTSSSTTNSSLNALNNASVTFTVPTGETDKLVAYFSAQEACYGGTSLKSCRVRILVDGSEMAPTIGSDSVFDTNGDGFKTTSCSANPCTPTTLTNSFQAKTSNNEETRTIMRTSGNITAGSHTVIVEFGTSSSSTTLAINGFSLVVNRIKVS